MSINNEPIAIEPGETLDAKMIPITVDPTVAVYARTYFQHPDGVQATLTAETRCTRCNQHFKAGDTVIAHCQPNPADATWEHQNECPIIDRLSNVIWAEIERQAETNENGHTHVMRDIDLIDGAINMHKIAQAVITELDTP
jgi:hypothetical protein